MVTRLKDVVLMIGLVGLFFCLFIFEGTTEAHEADAEYHEESSEGVVERELLAVFEVEDDYRKEDWSSEERGDYASVEVAFCGKVEAGEDTKQTAPLNNTPTQSNR